MDSQEHCSNFSCQVLNLIIIYLLFICFIHRTKIEHSFDGPTIVYCPTKKGTELVSKELCGRCSDFFMLGGRVWKGDGGEGGGADSAHTDFECLYLISREYNGQCDWFICFCL